VVSRDLNAYVENHCRWDDRLRRREHDLYSELERPVQLFLY